MRKSLNIQKYFEQTTQEAVSFRSFNKINVAEKTPEHVTGVFLFLSCISYTNVVDIMKIIRRHHNLFILFLNKKQHNDNSPSKFNIYAYNGQCKIIIN